MEVRLAKVEHDELRLRATTVGMSVQRCPFDAAMSGSGARSAERRPAQADAQRARFAPTGILNNVNQLAKWANPRARRSRYLQGRSGLCPGAAPGRWFEHADGQLRRLRRFRRGAVRIGAGGGDFHRPCLRLDRRPRLNHRWRRFAVRLHLRSDRATSLAPPRSEGAPTATLTTLMEFG
jgi:hypothetical protein